MSTVIQIDGYTILEEIGKGGMGRVYRAVQNSISRTVAIKTLEKSLLMDDDAASRMVREARISGRLLHENIVKIHDAGESHGTYFISMELLSQGDLTAQVNQGLAPSAAVKHAIDLADALDFAHKQGFVHRDIKPENILLRDDGAAVITDFGIARPIDSKTNLTVTGAIIGTPQFMSPEQTKGLPLDGRSDLYSLASVLFYMLTGKTLFEGDSILALTYQQVHQPIPKLLPPYHKLQWFFDKALAKQPEDRFQSGAEMKLALQKLSEVIKKIPPESVRFRRIDPNKEAKHRSWRRWFGGGAGAVMVVLLSVGSMLWYQSRYPTSEYSTTEQATSELSASELSTSEPSTPEPSTSELSTSDAVVSQPATFQSTTSQPESAESFSTNPNTSESVSGGSDSVSGTANINVETPAITDDNAQIETQMSELQIRVQTLLSESEAIMQKSNLLPSEVQQVVSNIKGVKTISPDDQTAALLLNDLKLRLTGEFERLITANQFETASKQLALLGFVNSATESDALQQQLRKERDRYQQAQKQQQLSSTIDRLIASAEAHFERDNLAGLAAGRKDVEALLKLNSDHPEGLRLRSFYGDKVVEKYEQAMREDRLDDAGLWVEQLTRSLGYQELASSLRENLNHRIEQQQEQRRKAQALAKQKSQLNREIDQLLNRAMLTPERIIQAEQKLNELLLIDPTALNQQTIDVKLAAAYQQLADNYLQQKEYDMALSLVDTAILKLPEDQQLRTLKQQIQKSQQRRRRNISSF